MLSSTYTRLLWPKKKWTPPRASPWNPSIHNLSRCSHTTLKFIPPRQSFSTSPLHSPTLQEKKSSATTFKDSTASPKRPSQTVTHFRASLASDPFSLPIPTSAASSFACIDSLLSSKEFDPEKYLNRPSIPIPPIDPASNLYLQLFRTKISNHVQRQNDPPRPPPQDLLNALLHLDIYKNPLLAWDLYAQLTMRSHDSFAPSLCPGIPAQIHEKVLRCTKRLLNEQYAEQYNCKLPSYVVRSRVEFILEVMRIHDLPLANACIFTLIDLYGRCGMHLRTQFWLEEYLKRAMPYTDVLMNAVLSGYVNSPRRDMAEAWMETCMGHGVKINPMTYSLLMRLFYRTKDISAADNLVHLVYPSTAWPERTLDRTAFFELLPQLARQRKVNVLHSSVPSVDLSIAYWIMLFGSLPDGMGLSKAWTIAQLALPDVSVNLRATLNALVFAFCYQLQEGAAEEMVHAFAHFDVTPNAATFNHLLKLYAKTNNLSKLNALGKFLYDRSGWNPGQSRLRRPHLTQSPRPYPYLNAIGMNILCRNTTGKTHKFWTRVLKANPELQITWSHVRHWDTKLESEE